MKDALPILLAIAISISVPVADWALRTFAPDGWRLTIEMPVASPLAVLGWGCVVLFLLCAAIVGGAAVMNRNVR